MLPSLLVVVTKEIHEIHFSCCLWLVVDGVVGGYCWGWLQVILGWVGCCWFCRWFCCGNGWLLSLRSCYWLCDSVEVESYIWFVSCLKPHTNIGHVPFELLPQRLYHLQKNQINALSAIFTKINKTKTKISYFVFFLNFIISAILKIKNANSLNKYLIPKQQWNKKLTNVYPERKKCLPPNWPHTWHSTRGSVQSWAFSVWGRTPLPSMTPPLHYTTPSLLCPSTICWWV